MSPRHKRLALLYIHQMNRVNSRNDLSHEDISSWLLLLLLLFKRKRATGRPQLLGLADVKVNELVDDLEVVCLLRVPSL